ncbi:histone-lysine n-methyltransferase suv39h [Holotrichia oblita]|uniref:Histone-lysine n-methyltransferase suv39h n=1 Tax=Holotrichia oblita TaxID=644536 RepID=A0ACB9SUI2_HOLOL|nr:histone-lysine n-methyltransferase suv39h [Holotrichia oblita]
MEFSDDYEHPSTDAKLIYTPENIPTKSTKHKFEEFTSGCKCMTLCRVQHECSCLRNFLNYDYDFFTSEDNLQSMHENYTLLKRDMPIYECNQNCLCSQYCGNRLVQYGPRKNLKIVPFDNNSKEKLKSKGAGLFTTAIIKKGNFVCEYAGEIISSQEANKRFKTQEKQKLMNYIFFVNETFGTNIIKTFVDPSIFGNIGRYINHSCDPNCEVIPVRVDNVIPKLCIFATKDINVDEEITFDYGDGQLGFCPLDQTVNKKKKCLCDFVNCRKYLPFCKETE